MMNGMSVVHTSKKRRARMVLATMTITRAFDFRIAKREHPLTGRPQYCLQRMYLNDEDGYRDWHEVSYHRWLWRAKQALRRAERSQLVDGTPWEVM